MADGEATPEDYRGLRPHLRRCAGCRATLRGLYEAQPALGALVPAGVVGLAADPAGATEAGGRLLGRLYEGAVAGLGDKLLRAQAVVEAATSTKGAAVAATAAVAAGGVSMAGRDAPTLPPAAPRVAQAAAPAATATGVRVGAAVRGGDRRAAAGRGSAGAGGRRVKARTEDRHATSKTGDRGRRSGAGSRATGARKSKASTKRGRVTAGTSGRGGTAGGGTAGGGTAGGGGTGGGGSTVPAPVVTPAPAAATAAPSAPSTAGGDFGFEG